MSIQLMTLVRKSALPTNAKFVLMALADWADDSGMNCYPSVYELSEYMTCSERTVQRLLRELEEGGWIAVVGNANGGGSSRHYALNVSKLEEVAAVEHARREAEKERRRRDRKNETANPFNQGCQFVTPVNLSPVTTTAAGVTSATKGVTTTTSRGDTAVTPSTIDPSKIHQRTTKSSAIGLIDVDDELLADWNKVRKAKSAGEATKAAVKLLQTEARKAGLTDSQAITVCCGNGWQGFRAAWYLKDNPSGHLRAPQRQQPQSFAQQDREASMAHWEAMTGRVHPDRLRPVNDHRVIDITPGTPQYALEG